jgi:hypothetical protein
LEKLFEKSAYNVRRDEKKAERARERERGLGGEGNKKGQWEVDKGTRRTHDNRR